MRFANEGGEARDSEQQAIASKEREYLLIDLVLSANKELRVVTNVFPVGYLAQSRFQLSRHFLVDSVPVPISPNPLS
jgi:hypothetical protein